MRALVVVCNPNLPDIVYFSGDKDFCDTLNKKAAESRWIPEEDVSSTRMDMNVLLQFFQSLIASQQALSSMLLCPYQSILGEDDTLVVVRKHQNFIFIAINGDGTEMESFLLHKILVFQRIIAFFFGHCPESLSCNNEKSKQTEIWDTLTRILDTWSYLYHVEQSFLMEAVERLHVNQFLNGICIELLEKTLTSSGDKSRVHALLLVKGKLLALFSSQNAPELQPSNILMITLIVESFFPSPRTVTEGSDNVTSAKEGRKVGASQFYVAEDYISASEDNKSDNSSYYSPRQGNSPPQSDNEDEITTASIHPSSSEAMTTPVVQLLSDRLTEGPDIYSIPASESAMKPARNQPRTSQSDGPSSSHQESCSKRYPPEGILLNVFLQQEYCKFVPHTLTLIPVLPGITMVVVAERKRSFGNYLGDALDEAQNIYNKMNKVQLRGPKHPLVGKLEENIIKNINAFLKTIKGNTKNLQDSLLIPMGKIKELCSRTSNQDSLVAEIEILSCALRNIFKIFFLQHQKLVLEIQPNTLEKHLRCQAYAQDKLEYYNDYLGVKGEKNFTITTYLENFPGLVHFIHVDRKANQLTAPSVSINYGTEKKGESFDAHRNLVWSCLEKAQHFFENEHTTIHFEMGDFQLSYFLYFENAMGGLTQTINLPKMPKEGHYPGMQAETFFRHITEKCFPSTSESVRCCELFCIHLAVVPINAVAQQARKLREHLWETCGVAAAPLNLL